MLATSTSPGTVDIVTIPAYQRATVSVGSVHGAALYAAAALIGAPLMLWRRSAAAREKARLAARRR